MSISDFSIWIEDILVSHDWDIDHPEVQWLITKHQSYLMSLYAANATENQVVRAFAQFWHSNLPMGA